MKLVGHIFNAIFSILAVICLVLLIVFGWSATGWKALTIPTKSMHPAIPPGSLVFVHSVPVSSLKVGDVITYTNPIMPSETISHRIIEIKSNSHGPYEFITKGDANTFADIPFGASNIIGRVVGHVPYVGSLLTKAKKPIVILPIVYGAALLIMAEEVIRMRDYMEENQRHSAKKLKTRKSIPLSSSLTSEVVDSLIID